MTWSTTPTSRRSPSSLGPTPTALLTTSPPCRLPRGRLSRRLSDSRRPLPNVDAQIRQVGELNADLAAILVAAGAIAAPNSDKSPAGEDDSPEVDLVAATKVRVAESIVGASKAIPDAAMRVRLVSSLELEEFFPVANVQPETGPLLGLLIAEGICDDDSSLFEHFAIADWDTLRYAIDQSTMFAEFMTPQLLNAGMSTQILESADIKTYVKRAVLKRFEEFIDVGNSAALAAAVRAALATNTQLARGYIVSVASGTGDCDLVVKLLHDASDGISTDETVEILRQLAAPYNELTTSGARLTFPRNDHHTAVLGRLHEEGRIAKRAHSKSLLKPARIEVTVN
jgi:hypothetical protein